MTKTDYNIESILHTPYKLKNLILDGVLTKTSHFLLPGLHISVNKSEFAKYFTNAYLNDEELIHIIKTPVFCLFKTKAFDEGWSAFEADLRKSPRCIYDYDVGKYEDEFLVMFLYDFPKAYKDDYQRFLNGEYSKFSEHFRNLFPKTITNPEGKEIENSLYGVINKTITLKKRLEQIIGQRIDSNGEYWEKWTPEREIFRKK